MTGNLFDSPRAAALYARARPAFQPLVVARIRRRLRLRAPLARALDAGCGTGQSTLALLEIAAQVVGVDPSAAMLALAPTDPRITYLCASAEALPLPDASFELITVASAFQWLERAAFFPEAWRVLRPRGWLVLYDNAFTGEMREEPAFQRWLRDIFLARYPLPPSQRAPVGPREARAAGFSFVREERYEHTVQFSAAELGEYLLAQTNCLAALASGQVTEDELRAWLLDQLTPFFTRHAGSTCTCVFRGAIRYLRWRER